MKNGNKLKGQLRSYMDWPIVLTILLLVMNGAVYAVDKTSGFLVSLFVVFYIIIVFVLYFRKRSQILGGLVDFAAQYGQVQHELLRELSLPYALVDEDGRIIWKNEEFVRVMGEENEHKISLFSLIPSFSREELKSIEDTKSYHIHISDGDYRADIREISLEQAFAGNGLIDVEHEDAVLFALYLFDETQLNRVILENKNQRLVTGLIYIDNYDEVIDSIEDVRQSMLGALVERKINKSISAIDGVVKKLEKDKYFIIFKYQYLEQLMEQKFALLTDVKTVNIGNEMPLTLSIGIGVGGSTYGQNYEFARTAIDLALGRGGDQAVVKDGKQISYFGGKTKQVEKMTRVKARVKAQALREIIQTKDRVIVMGHKMTDVDSFGAAVGVYRAAECLNKKAYIVINDVTTSLRPVMDCFLETQPKDKEVIVKSARAVELAEGNTAVVVVDTNRPSYTECQELLNKKKTIVVFDHHRRGGEIIDNATLSYIEPFASSACEMVAEMLQYFDDGLKISAQEADCLYAGIMIDTDNFNSKTGVRTFEAAAYLKRNGADINRIRKMFRSDMTEYKARAEAVRRAELISEQFAVTVCPSEGLISPTIVGAQAANELLNIIGVKASFVLTEFNHKIYVSARSIDEVNVQMVMERLGGGGHMTIAGAQLLDMTIDEAKELLEDTLLAMQQEGAL